MYSGGTKGLSNSTSSSAPIKSSLLLASHYKPLAKLTRTLLNSKRKRPTKKSYKGHTKSLNTNLGPFSTWCPRGLDLHFKPSPLRLGYNTGVNQIQLPRSLQRPSAFTFGYASGLVQRRITRQTSASLLHTGELALLKAHSLRLRQLSTAHKAAVLRFLEAAQLSDEDSIHRSKRTLSNLSAEASQLEQKRLIRRYSIGTLSIRRSTRPPIATLKHRLTLRGLNCYRPASRKHHPTNAKRLQQKRRLSARSASQTSSIPLQSVRS
ncbi:hypothetical protein DdX_10606 [Ditylenchus destructor]|uniref:Uncharacterized protein n=1 Tax=Ditylenchus destructor TaxID=166010 RepID=A0AAD4N3Q5_9BILA|nr:hypothetical protein DdX_10606 [Ditylenchus destructor]